MLTNGEKYRDEELTIKVNGEETLAIIRTPIRRAVRPALLINLAADVKNALGGDFFRIVPDIFLAAGHRVVSFSLPCHGERVNEYGEGIEGWANSIKAGIDVFADIRATGTTLIDLCLERDLAYGETIVIDGTSRAGLAALHILSAESRITAAAIHAPVTYIPAVTEYHGTEENLMVKRSNASALVPKLADKPLFIAIGSSDVRVGAEHCFEFYAGLRAVCKQNPPQLFTGPGPSHNTDPGCFAAETGYHAAAGFLLRHCAEKLKLTDRNH